MHANLNDSRRRLRVNDTNDTKDAPTFIMTDSNSHATPKTYPCPRCGTQTAWQDNKYKPFCSSRCKLIDLGAWANEDYTLPAETTPFSDEL